ncbi:MAG TPA: 2-C-methyl-D-erythritol 2,4-cyclodiphosphate synthase, partial [Lachnospiraceae bacterium]|nr:2-C-methyl-D-erythritol 2,4-cyclodiphosphate synthase [Lachnospiraceae bacterium]
GFTGSGEGISSQAICSISSYYEHMVNNAPAGCASCGGCARN